MTRLPQIHRPFLIWAALLAMLAGGLSFVPLFDLLGYELSLAVALAVTPAAMPLGWSSARQAPDLGGLGRGAARALGLLVVPLAISSTNALRVKNCDYPGGLAFYALLPGVTALVASALGAAAAILARGHRGALVLLFLLPFAGIGLSVLRVYDRPVIFAYDPFFGFYSGALYDEDIRVTTTLLAYRGWNLAWTVALVALALGLRASALRRRLVLGAAAAALVALVATWPVARRRFFPTGADVAEGLGGRHETAHFILLYARGSATERTIEAVARDHEFRYAQLVRDAGVAPPQRITSFVFPSAADKRRWMGAASTYIAKPWRREIYLQHEDFPHGVVHHELAHVFGAEFGDPLLGLTLHRRGLLPQLDMGLVEGLAVALADDGAGALVPHEWAAAMKALGLLPRLERIFGAGFYGLSSQVAYTVAGSFCGWLIAERGMPAFRRLYRSGGDFQGVYGASLVELEGAWTRFLDAIALDPSAQGLARERFRRPAVWHKVCAHRVAALRTEARAATAAGDRARAERCLRQIVADDPGDPAGLLELARLLAATTAPRAAAAARAAEQHRSASTPLRAQALAILGDLALRAGQTEEARRVLDAIEALSVDEAVRRQARVKRAALDDVRVGREILAYLERGELAPIAEAVRKAPDSGLAAYLHGRGLQNRGQTEKALAELDRARKLGVGDPLVARELARLEPLVAYGARRLDDAALRWERLATDPGSSLATRASARDWLDRVRFEQTRQLPDRVARGGEAVGKPSPAAGPTK